MGWFEYQGTTPGGTAISGRLEAEHADAARLELARMQIELTELRSAPPAGSPSSALTADELMFFNQQLAGLARAGLALDDGLAQLARDVQSRRLRRWIDDLVEDLRRGTPIDKALAAREAGLPVLYSRVVRAGVQTGKLPTVLLNLNQHLQTAATTRRILWEAASYPLVLAALSLALMVFFFLGVVPEFRDVFDLFVESGAKLPFATQMAITISEHFGTVLVVLGVAAGCLVLLWQMLRFTTTGRQLRERLVLMLPVIGGIHRSSLLARFLRSMSVAVETGMALPDAIRLSSDATGSAMLNADAGRIAGEIEAGQPILKAGQQARVIPPLFGYCVHAAAGRQNLPEALDELARTYEARVVHGHGMLRLLLMPLFILFIGTILLFAVLAMYMPMVQSMRSAFFW